MIEPPDIEDEGVMYEELERVLLTPMQISIFKLGFNGLLRRKMSYWFSLERMSMFLSRVHMKLPRWI